MVISLVRLETLNHCADEDQQQFTGQYAADAYQVILNTGNTDMRTPVRKLRVTYEIPYVYDCIKFKQGTGRSHTNSSKSKRNWNWTKSRHE
jgi:hypothetical protein